MTRRWSIFLVTSSLFFLSQFYRTSNAVIAPQLIQDLDLDTEGLGLMSASFFYGFALTQIPLSVLLDKIGARRMMTALSLVGILGAVIFSRAESLSLAVLARILLGVGMACNLMGTLKLLTDWFEPLAFGTLSGLVFSIGTMGNMVATTPLVILAEKFGWRLSFQLIAGLHLLLTLAFYVVAHDRPQRQTGNQVAFETTLSFHEALGHMRLLLKQKDYWIISFGTFARYGIFAAIQALWAGPFLMEVMGYSAIKTGNLIFLLNVGLTLGGPFWGALSDRLFKTRKWVIISGLIILALITLALAVISADTALIVSALLFFGFGLAGAVGILMYPHIRDLMPIEMAGAAMTGINFFTMMGSAVFMQGLGSLMQYIYPHTSRGPAAFQTAFLLCAGWLLLVSVLYLFTKDKKLVEIRCSGENICQLTKSR
jgi:sugar phosphate permease